MTLETRYDGLISSDLYDAQTTDGVLITDLLKEADTFVAQYNTLKNAMLSFMGHETTKAEADVVAQITVKWQRFREFGKPDVRSRTKTDFGVTTAMEGYQTAIEWTDFAEVLGLSASVIRDYIRGVAEGDLSRTYSQMWEQFFEKTSRNVEDILLKRQVVQLPFYNGDGRIPPRVGNKIFSSGHNHYLRAANTGVITAADLHAGVNTLIEHGFDNDVYIFGSQATVDAIMDIGEPDIAKIQVVNRFIPQDAVNINQPGALMSTYVPINPVFNVVGTFGTATIAVAKDVPDGYIGFFSHQGPLSPNNPLQVRLPENKILANLRRVTSALYPFVGSYYQRMQGLSTRQFGNGVAMQWVWSSGSAYQNPVWVYDLF